MDGMASVPNLMELHFLSNTLSKGTFFVAGGDAEKIIYNLVR